jgi:hypothetical protein
MLSVSLMTKVNECLDGEHVRAQRHASTAPKWHRGSNFGEFSLRKLESNLWGTTGAFMGDPGVPRENRMGTKVTITGREHLSEIVKGTLR